MKLTTDQIKKLKILMSNSAQKGNLANAGCVFDGEKVIEYSESLVVSDNDATAHSERMLVEKVCKEKETNYTAGLKMLTIVEPCLMCMSACSQAGYSEIMYIIPASRYVKKIAWMTDVTSKVNKQELAKHFSEPIAFSHLTEYEEEFCEVFEEVMKDLIGSS